jgi:hypothetical protein
MSTIWEVTEDALDGLGVTVAANALVLASETARPDAYIVYQVISSPPRLHADDAETLRSWTMQVSYYDRAGLVSMPDIQGAMEAAGFTSGSFRELPYNQLTRHYGMALDFHYLASS